MPFVCTVLLVSDEGMQRNMALHTCGNVCKRDVRKAYSVALCCEHNPTLLDGDPVLSSMLVAALLAVAPHPQYARLYNRPNAAPIHGEQNVRMRVTHHAC